MLKKFALVVFLSSALFFGNTKKTEASLLSSYYQNYFARILEILRETYLRRESINAEIETKISSFSYTNPHQFQGFPSLVNIPSLSPTTSPAVSPTTTPSPTLSPTIIPSTTPTSSPSPIPTTVVTPSTDAVKIHIMGEINEYRKSQGLSEVQTDSYTCNFAKIRAQEISLNFNHDGFRQRLSSNSLPYPSYSQITENISMNSDYRNVVESWISSSGHAENMRKDTPFVCVERNGNFYAYEGWKP